jgi:hypothetical protein
MEAATNGNGYDRATLERLLTDIDNADDALASLRGEYMASCKGPRADIKAAKDKARDANIPTAAFNTLIKNRRLTKQQRANVDALEADQQGELVMLEDALGDFLDSPLGQAALRRERPQQNEAALDTLA